MSEDKIPESLRAVELLKAAWSIIANAGWDGFDKTPGWQEEALEWRDRYFVALGMLAEDLPWPSWLENMTDRQRIHVIVRALDECAAGHGARPHPHGSSERHCTAPMAERFLLKLLRPEPGLEGS